MAFKSIFLLAAVLLSCISLAISQDTCGKSTYEDAGLCDRDGVSCEGSSHYIVGGVPARLHELPYQISLHWQGGHVCGGVLWDDMHVITAQHCTEGYPAPQFEVVVGDHIRSEPNDEKETIPVATIVEHEDYDDYWLNDDIALLTLEHPVTISSNIMPICFDQAYSGDNAFGEVGCASGWGSTGESGGGTDELRYATLSVMAKDECLACPGWLPDEIKDGMICIGVCGETNEKDTCYGDSGGPVAQKVGDTFYIVGLTSWGYECGGEMPGVYVDVAYYEDWINENM